MVLHFKILNELTDGNLYKNAEEIPTNFDEFYQGVLENMEKVIQEDKEKKTMKRDKLSRAPLKDNETYMKVEDKVKEK